MRISAFYFLTNRNVSLTSKSFVSLIKYNPAEIVEISIKVFLSAVDDARRSDWFKVTSAPGLGTVVYLPLTYPNISLTKARVYSNIQARQIELIFK